MKASPFWKDLQDAADRARQAAEIERAVDLYTQTLTTPDLPWEARAGAQQSQAECHFMLGEAQAAEAVLTGLADEAARRNDSLAQATALIELSEELRLAGRLDEALQAGRQAVVSAERAGHRVLRVRALSAAAVEAEMACHDHCATALDYLQQARALGLSEPLPQMYLCAAEGNIAYHQGEINQSRQVYETGLRLARLCGERLAGLNDLALQGQYFEQALEIFAALGHRLLYALAVSNFCTWWTHLGLFRRTQDYSRLAQENSQIMRQEADMAYALGNFAEASLEDGLARAHAMGDAMLELEIRLMDILAALYQAQPEAARRQLQEIAAAVPSPQGIHLDQWPRLLAYQAMTDRLEGNEAGAAAAVREVFTLVETGEKHAYAGAYLDHTAWWCYRALQPAAPEADLTPDQWQALHLGYQHIVRVVESMSDAGLRRGSLHRIRARCLLLREWLKWAPRYADPQDLAAYTALVQRPGRLSDVFRRLLKVGTRLNALRDPLRLPEEIVEEVSELTGAERIALVILDEHGGRRAVKTLVPLPPFGAMSAAREPAPADFLAEIKPWLEETTLTRLGLVRLLNPAGALFVPR